MTPDAGVATRDAHLPDIDAGSIDPGSTDAGVPDTDAGASMLDPRLRALVCDLDDDQLLRAALRGNACLDLAFSAPYFGAARSSLYDTHSYFGSYAQTAVTNCAFTACLADATSCAEAETCLPLAFGEACDEPYAHRCTGDHIEVCVWRPGARDEYHWQRVQDCSLMGASCVADGTRAYCDGSDLATEACDGLGYDLCDGDVALRCLPGADGGQLVPVACDAMLAGGTCAELGVGGEVPAAMCVRATECPPDSGSRCDPETGVLTFCAHGEQRQIRCTDYGYAGCDGESGWNDGCAL